AADASGHGLPLDLAAGASHTACVRPMSGAVGAPVTVEIAGGGRVHRLALTPGGAPVRPVAVR
ncbi:MAG: hypothetical protein HYV62_13160, partial [Candidatus Rokubacteria bacterium]|nr:hypothetical protein [Candidatus Rokubacteria bacterium]